MPSELQSFNPKCRNFKGKSTVYVGGWSCTIHSEAGIEMTLRGRAILTTNNRMELVAALMGIRWCPVGSKVLVESDSKYVVNGSNNWMKRWMKDGLAGIKNPDLWREMDRLKKTRDVRFEWVRGHSGNTWNEACDKLAKKECARAKFLSKGWWGNIEMMDLKKFNRPHLDFSP